MLADTVDHRPIPDETIGSSLLYWRSSWSRSRQCTRKLQRRASDKFSGSLPKERLQRWHQVVAKWKSNTILFLAQTNTSRPWAEYQAAAVKLLNKSRMTNPTSLDVWSQKL